MAKQAPKKKTKKKLFLIPGFFMRLANILAVIALLIAYTSPYIDPNDYYIPAFFGLSYPIWLIINVFFVVFWAFTRRRFFLVSLLAIAVGYSYVLSHFNIRFSEKATGGANQLKIVTYNVKHLNESDRDFKKPEATNTIFQLITSQKPDIVCLQEFYWPKKDFQTFINTFIKESGLPYYSMRNYLNYMDGKKMDCLIIFSRYPILNQNSIDYGNRHFALLSDILFHEDTLRVINTHLQSIYFGFDDYRFVNDVTESPGTNDDLKAGSKRIFWKLRKAFFRRAVQADRVGDEVAKSPYATILCGDFNDTPASYAYHRASAGLNDAFSSGTTGYGNTYAGKLPLIRIDHIFYSDHFDQINYKSHKKKLSDHHMVSATLEYLKN